MALFVKATISPCREVKILICAFLQIMLVFAKEDAQSESFLLAAERGRFKCQLCKTSEAAMELYLNNQPEVMYC